MAEMEVGMYYNLTENDVQQEVEEGKEECDLKVSIPCIEGSKRNGIFRKRIIEVLKVRRDTPCLEEWYKEYRKKFQECEDLQ